MDTIDALGRPDGPDDFIILSGGAELAPLLMRLHASKRTTAIYVDAATAEADRSLADATLTAAAFAAFLTAEEKAPPPPEPAGIDRADIEAFARKIHAATNIPLFSPKTFTELFRHLTDEISENGYHFQSTAKNVADRMTAAGRTVTRRQVVFIVKGLALKGHVFSTGDTAESLAEVFREQAHYLITNAGMTLDEKQELLLSAWFKSSAPAPAATTAKTVAPAGEQTPAPAVTHSEPPSATVKLKPPAPQKPTAQPKAPLPGPAAVKPVELPKSAARPAPVPHASKPGASSAAREEAKAVIAARIAASAKLKPSRGVPVPAKPAPKAPSSSAPSSPSSSSRPAQPQANVPAATPPHAPQHPPAPKPTAAAPAARGTQPSKSNSDALEHSILAAIAEAVDVLVEDSAEEAAGTRSQPQRRPVATGDQRRPAAPSTPTRADKRGESPDEDDDGDEGGDIGDQIQRIIASYNRNRTDE
jgi:hypothetical protein